MRRSHNRMFQYGGLVIGRKTYLAVPGKTIDDLIAEVNKDLIYLSIHIVCFERKRHGSDPKRDHMSSDFWGFSLSF